MSRTYDPANDTPVNRIRDIIGDVDMDNTDVLEGLQDEEVTWAYEEAGNSIPLGAARAARKLAARFHQLADVRAGDYAEQFTRRAEAFLKLASSLESKFGALACVPTAGGVEAQEIRDAALDDSLEKPAFTTKQFDNYRADDPDSEETISDS